jgi:ribonuclease HII
MQTVDELLKESIQDLREKFVTRSHRVPKGFLQALECDTRSGARELARHIRLRQKKNRAEGQRLRNLLRYECELWQQGLKLIAGVDEAGMSPLAGPVVAGAVILPSGYKLKGLNDSKKILEESRREELEEQIKREAISFSTGRAEVEEIDTINIYHAVPSKVFI